MVPKHIIILAGPSAAGKSTLAHQLSAMLGLPIFSIRKHYADHIVPQFLAATGQKHDQKITRALHMQAADWLYSTDPAAHARLLIPELAQYPKGVIIESLRIKEDIVYLAEQYPETVRIIFLDAPLEIRLARKLVVADPLYDGKSDTIYQSLVYEWEHFRLEETKQYVAKNAHGFIYETASLPTLKVCRHPNNT